MVITTRGPQTDCGEKNRRPNVGGSFGVDLNRNWDDHWAYIGSSSNPSSDTYHGTGPFSEPESAAVGRFVNAVGPNHAAIDFHSYGQLVNRPLGWTTTPSPDEALAKKVGDQYAADIKAFSNQTYVSQPSWQLYYTSGSAQDWYYSGGNIPLSYTVELRDTGRYGFELPPDQIIPTARENWNAFRGLVNYLIAN